MAQRGAFELLVILALISGCIGVDPCTDYKLLKMHDGLRSSDFYSKDTTVSICDRFEDSSPWYRFKHDAGDRLIEKPVEPWFCGTEIPIWMNGTHPTDTAETTAEVCGTYSTDVCGWKGTVRIQLCNESESEFFVYLLTMPPGCAMAYCVDAASRAQCKPPLIWLQEEFKCGVRIETTASTSVHTTELPCSGRGQWGPWGPWSDCPKTCDWGLQQRRRTCCEPTCIGVAISFQLCAFTNCKELPEEKDKGIVIRLQYITQDTMSKVVENQKTIETIIRTGINSACSRNASLCCGIQIDRIFSPTIDFVTSEDIYTAKGFPKQKSDGTVDLKIIAIISETVKQAVCNNDSKRLRSRQVPSTNPNFVPFEVMKLAAINSASDILQETDLTVGDYLDPATYPDDSQGDSPCPVVTCIVPIVICCAVIPAIAITVGCIVLQMMKKKKRTPNLPHGKDLAAPNMVHPFVNTGQTKKDCLPGKPS